MKDKPLIRKRLEITGVFDIETQNWDTFVLGALLVGGDYYEQDWRREDELVDRILKVEGTIWGHNAGKYDTLWLLQHIAKREIEARVFCAGQRIVNLIVGDLQVRDSAALIPMSLKKAALIGGQQKGEPNLPCHCAKPCGGFCSVTRQMGDRALRKLSPYLRQDCHCTLEMLKGLQDYADREDLDLTGTIGSSAWNCAKRIYELPPAIWKPRFYKFAAKAKHGGRVQVFRPIAASGHRYDINSSYPAALKRTKLPVGKMEMQIDADARRAFDSEKEGIYEARVHVPPLFVPPLPVRFSKRVGYPIGSFVGHWTRPELVYAQSHGVRIEHISYALAWESSEAVFEPFIDKIMTLRWKAMKAASQDPKFADNPKKHPLCEWLKLNANSAVGKLGQNPEVDNVKVNPAKVPTCPGNAPCAGVPTSFCGLAGCCPHKCSGMCQKWECLDVRGDHRIWKYTTWRLADCAHVQWSAYGLAAARIELHRELVSDGESGGSAIYCDTDSCYATKPRERNRGTELGEWAYEGRLKDFVALAPKVYRYTDPDQNRKVVRAKGIPDAADHWDDISNGRDVPINRGVLSFRSATKAGEMFKRKETHRHINVNVESYGDRIASGDVTLPLPAEKVEALR